MLLRPEELTVTEGNSGTVDHIEFFGHDTLYYIRRRDGDVLRCRTTGAPRFGIGSGVDLCHSGVCTVAFPRNGSAGGPPRGDIVILYAILHTDCIISRPYSV